MLYSVPQTDSAGEAAMAALVLRLRTSAPKPEVFPVGAGVDDQLALILAQWVARASSALGDRATLPLLQWDASLDGAVIALASRQWLDTRGRNRQAGGADAEIDTVAKEALEFLARCKPGTPEGKRENPRFVDSSSNRTVDGVWITSNPRADSWTCGHSSGGWR